MSTGVAGRQDGASASPVPDLVAVLAQFIARSGREAQVCDGLLPVVEAARSERGNLGYDLYQVTGKPWAFYVLANWADRTAADAHLESPRVQEFVAAHTSDLAAAPTRFYAGMLSRPDPDPSRPRPVPNSEQVTFFPFFNAKSDQVDAVRQTLLGAVDSTRSEEGCLDYDLYQSFDDSSVFFYRENWTGQAVLDAHMNRPGFYRVVRGEIDPRLTVPWSGISMTMVSPAGRPQKPLD